MNTIANTLYKTIQEVPNDLACSLNGHHLSYRQLGDQIDRMRILLTQVHVNEHAKVVLLLPNIIDTVVLFYGCNALGATVILLHPLSSMTQITHQLDLVEATHIFYLDALAHRYQINNKQSWFKISVANSTTGFTKWWLKLRYVFVKGQSLPSLISKETIPPLQYQQDAVILFSSGTTNKQKAIKLSNEAFNALAQQMEACIVPTHNHDSMFCVLPFFHGFGLGITLHSVLALGGRVILVPRLNKNTMIKTLLKEKPTYIAGVPFLFHALLKDKRFVEADLSFIKQVFVGGEMVPTSLVDNFNALLKNNNSKATLQVGYGTTETLTAVTLMPPAKNVNHAVGLPFKGNDIKILLENGSIATTNQPGEICIAGPTLMNGYIDHEQNMDAFIMIDNKRYYKSNDIGYLDEQNCLYFLYRKDDLIKVRGFYVNPNEIEQALYQLEYCVEAKVFVDENDCLSAMMVCNREIPLTILKKETSQQMKPFDDWSIPKRFIIVNEIPKNQMKKFNKTAILEALIQHEIEFLQEWFL